MSAAGIPARLLWIVDAEAIECEAVPPALRAGVRWLYLRDAAIDPATWRSYGRAWEQLVAPPPRIVVGGGAAWARRAGWGTHRKALEETLPPAERDAWPLVGRSVHDVAETRHALGDRPDYLVAGPVFPTGSKPGHPGIGPQGLARIVEAAAGCPVFAIGGIVPAAIERVTGAGAYGVAVRSGITAAKRPGDAAAAYLGLLPVDSD